MNKTITFNEGEKREVTAIITSKKQKEIVVVASAEYKLKKMYDGTIVQQGSCEIEGNEATILLDLAKKGNYELEVSASVGREIIISKALVEVN